MTLPQMTSALVWAIENPPRAGAVRLLEVEEIRRRAAMAPRG